MGIEETAFHIHNMMFLGIFLRILLLWQMRKAVDIQCPPGPVGLTPALADNFINMYILCIYMSTAKLTKIVKKYGNSGGVYLPSSWIGSEIEVSLIRRPQNPGRDLTLALAGEMKHIVSILVYGSYARDEQENESDIDVIIVRDNHSKEIKIPHELKKMNYDIRLMTVRNKKSRRKRHIAKKIY